MIPKTLDQEVKGLNDGLVSMDVKGTGNLPLVIGTETKHVFDKEKPLMPEGQIVSLYEAFKDLDTVVRFGYDTKTDSSVLSEALETFEKYHNFYVGFADSLVRLQSEMSGWNRVISNLSYNSRRDFLESGFKNDVVIEMIVLNEYSQHILNSNYESIWMRNKVCLVNEILAKAYESKGSIDTHALSKYTKPLVKTFEDIEKAFTFGKQVSARRYVKALLGLQAYTIKHEKKKIVFCWSEIDKKFHKNYG